ncbi:MAG: hypothetical protein RBR32_09385, partial [Bacteroidales bacterium]|nr:hypothetical protein [Bacteroidales bacterium]
MKKIIFLFMMFLLVSNLSFTQVKKPFTQRTSQYTPSKTIYNLKGDFTLIGNTNLSLQSYSNNGGNNAQMKYIDVDTDLSTVNSSSATLTFLDENDANPNCSNIVYAGLYWTGRANNGGTGEMEFTVGGTTDNRSDGNSFNGYSLSISQTGSSSRVATYTFTPDGAGDNVVFTFTSNGVTVNSVKVKVGGGSEIIIPSSQYSISSGGNSSSNRWLQITFDNPYEINTGAINIEINSLRKRRENNDQSATYFYASVKSPSFDLNRRQVQLKKSGQTYQTITANSNDIYYPMTADGQMYSAYAEVTDYVRTHGLGEYFVANIALIEGNGGSTGYYGGWAMIVVYENSKMNWRDITIFDGHAYVAGSITADFELPISGFHTAQHGDINMKLGVVAGEGDVSISGDYLQIRNHQNTSWISLSHSGNSTNNFYNSSIFTGGNPRNPNLINNTGLDISMFDIPNAGNSVISNNQTSTKFRYGTTQDTYIIFMIAMSVDAYIPTAEAFIELASIDNVPYTQGDPIHVDPGEDTEFTVELRNKGTEPINDFKLIIPLPFASSYVSASRQVFFNPAPSPNNLYFDPSYTGTGAIIWDIGTLPLPLDPDELLGTLTFRIEATTDCSILSNINCSPEINVSGLMTGTGAISQTTFNNQLTTQGYQMEGECIGEPINEPIKFSIHSDNYVNTNCSGTPTVIEFQKCNITAPIPITEFSGSFPAGSRFYDEYPVSSSSTEYTISNPYPNLTGVHTYYAIPPGASSCYFEFTIEITDLSSVPSVISPLTYCENDIAAPLTGTASNPSYSLYYYNSLTGNPQLEIIPSTSLVGTNTYYVAEAISGSCISTNKVPIIVDVNPLPIAPSLANSSQTELCFGSTGNIILSASGGLGDNLNWYSGSCEGTLIGTGNNLSISAPTTSTTYYAAWENSCGISDCASVSVTVLPQIFVNLNITGIIQYYNANTGQITVNTSGGNSPYSYTLNGGASQTSSVFSNLEAGIYTIVVTDSKGCTETAIITIDNALEIIANNDSETGVNGTTGQTNILNVFDNDLLDGSSVNPADVILTETISEPTGHLTLNPDGSVDLSPNTPGGTYTLTYQICELANPTNCDDATVTIEVIETADVSILKYQIDPSNLPVSNSTEFITVSPSVITAGTKIYYYLEVHNAGPDVSVNALVTDNMPSGITNAEMSLNYGNTWMPWNGTRPLGGFFSGGYNYILIRGDVDPAASGSLTNTATIYSSDTFDPDESNNEAVLITSITQSSDLSISKKAITAAVGPNSTIIYEITVLNSGPSYATNVIIEDIIDPNIISNQEYYPGSGSWLPWTGSLNIGDLDVNDTYTLLIRGVVVDASPDPNVNPIPNTASVSSDNDDPDPLDNDDTIYTPLNEEVDLSIVKTAPATIIAGNTITYSITVVNNDNTFTANNVHIHDDVDVSKLSDIEYSDDGGLTWNTWTGLYSLASLSPLDSFTILIRAKVKSDATGSLVNTATTHSDTPDNITFNNTSTTTTSIDLEADLEIIKIQINPSILPLSQAQIFGNPYDYVIDPVGITAGDEIYYALFYKNHGPSDATNVIIDDILPGFIVDWEASLCQANFANWPGSRNIGTIIAGGQCVLIVRGHVQENATGSLVNTTTISHSDPITDPDNSNNESTFTTPIRAMADLSISKTVDNFTPYIGDEVVFTILVTNNGPSTAHNVSVNDLLPNGYTYVSSSVTAGIYDENTGDWSISSIPFPGSETLTITARVNLLSGNYLNIATISQSDQYDPNPSDNTDSETTKPINVIIANDDLAGPFNGYDGAINILNVFTNDLLNGSPVDPDDLNLTVSVPNAYITLNPDGSVNLLPGTPAGTHILTYKICEIANPTNCDYADVIISVEEAEIIANDDNASANGHSGQANILNVFDNDELNGNPVDPDEVTLTETISDPTGSLTLNPDGSVDLAAGTPAGIYTLTYKICEVLNPANCDDATVTITVGMADIVANNDNFSSNPVPCDLGQVAGNVLLNDLLDGVAIVATDVNITIIDDGGLSTAYIDEHGDLHIPVGLSVGTFNMTYQICEKLNPTNCDQASIIVAITDTEAPNISCPDDVIVTALLGECEVTGISMDLPAYTDNCGIEVYKPERSDGLSLSDPYPLGVTNINWTIIDYGGNIAGCNYDVIVNPTLPNIQANDDNYQGLSSTGFVSSSVFDNDFLNGSALDFNDITVVWGDIEDEIGDEAEGIVINPDGTITVDAGTEPGVYTFEYEISFSICDDFAIVNDFGTVNILVMDPSYTVSKTAYASSVNSPAELGDIITYTIVLSNTGNVSIDNIVITDPMLTSAGVSLGTATESINTNNILEVAETWTYTADYAITQADIDAGQVYNQVLVTGEDTNDNPIDEDDDVTTPLDQNPSLLITKTVYESTYSVIGDVLHYVITVTNNGNVTISNLEV